MKILQSSLWGVLLLLSTSLQAQVPTNPEVPVSAIPMQLTPSESSFIQSGGPDDPMRVYLITQYWDSFLLRTPSKPIKADPQDTVLQLFLQRLYRTVTDSASLGVGIAAPQVGLLRQIIWVQRFDKENFPFEAYLNPKILQYTRLKRMGPEGCLSIPDTRDSVNRAYAILIEYDYPDGSHHIEMIEDFTAVIFQHEIDHLNGILFTDHLQEEIATAKEKEALIQASENQQAEEEKAAETDLGPNPNQEEDQSDRKGRRKKRRKKKKDSKGT